MSSAEAIELALALHAKPQRAAELRARPLPAHGIANLLRVALAQPEALQEASQATDLPPELLIDAARFFIEQQMLLQECEHDPWRVLGAQPGAPETQLREHQRLLVSLVHPDRSSDWPGAFADRVNKAWRALRSAEGRAQHDPGQLAALPSVQVMATPAVFRPDFVPAAAPGPVHSAPHRLRHLPALLVGGIVLVAGGVLLLDDWVREQYGQPSAPQMIALSAVVSPSSAPSDQGVASQGLLLRETTGVDGTDPAIPLGEPPQRRFDSGAALGLSAFFSYLDSHRRLHQRAPPDTLVVAAEAAVEAQPAKDSNLRPPTRVERSARPVLAPPSVSQTAPARPVAAVRRTAPRVVADPVPEPSQIAAVLLDDPQPAPVEELIAVDVQPVLLAVATADTAQGNRREQQVRTLLDRFGAHFQQGDLIGLLDLFSLNANQEHGGVPGLAAHYAQLFGSTRSRSVRFDGIHWIEERGHIRGAANIQITTWAAGHSRRELRSGRVEFEVRLDGDRALIQRWVPSDEAGEA